MTKSEVQHVVDKYYKSIYEYYGMSKFQTTFPYISIEDSPYPDEDNDVDIDCQAEWSPDFNEITLYWKNMKDLEHIIRTLIHEYQHYLQSPSWFKRYYNMGYHYNDHPYEVIAYKEEENYTLFLKK